MASDKNKQNKKKSVDVKKPKTKKTTGKEPVKKGAKAIKADSRPVSAKDKKKGDRSQKPLSKSPREAAGRSAAVKSAVKPTPKKSKKTTRTKGTDVAPRAESMGKKTTGKKRVVPAAAPAGRSAQKKKGAEKTAALLSDSGGLFTVPFLRRKFSFEPTKYNVDEEWWNTVTHSAAAVFSLLGFFLLVVPPLFRGDLVRVLSYGVFALSIFFVYFTSALYHGTAEREKKAFYHLLDHIAIFFLIAGTYTPVVLVMMGGVWGWSMFTVIWILALGGMVVKLYYAERLKSVSVGIYIMMGWLIVVAIGPMVEKIPSVTLSWLVAGGLTYTTGVIFYLWKKLSYHHTIWHLFAIAGSFFHFLAVYLYRGFSS